VQQKKLAKAGKLLNGEEYRRNKRDFADGPATISKKDHSELVIQAAHRCWPKGEPHSVCYDFNLSRECRHFRSRLIPLPIKAVALADIAKD
jgi:ribosomal protein S14